MPAEQENHPPRRHPRVWFNTTVTLDTDGKTYTYDRSSDISMNGVFVKTARPLPLGARARFSLLLSVGMRKEEIKGKCEVVRVVSLDDGLSEDTPGPGMGLKFIFLEDESSALLYQVIRHNQPPE